MGRIVGVIDKVYHNYVDKNNNKLNDDKVTHKIKIENELYIIKGKFCPTFVKEGEKVSITFNTWQPQGKDVAYHYVMKDQESGNLLIQSFNQSGNTDDIPIDDDLSNYEPDHHANMVEDNSPTSFNPNKLEKEITNPQLLKEQQIFCTAIIKSSIEGKFLEPTKDNLNKMILMLKDIYKTNFLK